ncbi:MAG: hypothetical protein E7508_01040 [Ruminococcus sp.]|nr:hypothetical protein [Ruminococcus sp.]
MNIKKKLIALTAVLAIAASFAGCSDNKDSAGKDETTEPATLSSEEYDQVTKHDLTIEPFVPGEGEVAQDAVEGGDSSSDNAEGGNAVEGGNAAAGGNDTANNNNATEGGNAAGGDTNSTAGGNGDSANTNNNDAVADNDAGSNNAELPTDGGLQVHNGTRTTMQAWWMDLSKSKDYVFNGEYLVAEFKIKDDAPDGIYPVTLDWLDFANWETQTIKFTGIDGAVIVGADAPENTFNDDDTPQIMVSNVSGKAGETVKVSINVKNNPGVIGNILRFSYNSDVLEYVGGGEGADFNGHFK